MDCSRARERRRCVTPLMGIAVRPQWAVHPGSWEQGARSLPIWRVLQTVDDGGPPAPDAAAMKACLRLLSLLLLTACSGGGNSASATAPASSGAAADYPDEPALDVDQATLDAALQCTAFTHPSLPPVLLVHGTFTAGFEQYDWTYLPLLADRGFDVCIVTYPDRGLGDQQVSAEYVVNALRRIRARSGRQVAMVGHSQGASMPRWAIKWWPSARNAVSTFVMLAGPNHGTTAVPNLESYLSLVPGLSSLPVGLEPAAFYQFLPDSNFVRVLNQGGETPGDIAYTSIYSGFYDELVEPAAPVPTAGLDWGQTVPNVSNIEI